MSLFILKSRFLSFAPKIWVEGDCLYARTSLIQRIFSLFAYSREVIVDRVRRLITIRVKSFWIFPYEKQIPFERVDYIDTDYKGIPKSFGISPFWIGATDRWDRFIITLVLKNPEEKIPLISFCGEGYVATGWSGVLLGGDEIVDLAGNQDEVFRNYLYLLQNFLKVPIGKPLEIETPYRCSKCGRPIPPSCEKCLYCGGERVEVKKGE
ncbi:zinc ribbon domain-containing protein [Candidatus Calescamantes bacterium]|nr:zinc ribbon domain-containing protein [Candidatus Calescamantes bacterium]